MLFASQKISSINFSFLDRPPSKITSPMNHIILFVDYFTPHIWGIEQLFWDITKALLNQQYRVSIVTSRHSKLLQEKESDKNLTIYRVWSSRQNFRRYSFIWGIRHREIIQSSTHIHTTTFTAAFPAWILAYIYNKKISITIHEVYKEIRHILKWRRGIFYRLYEVVLVRLPRDTIITPSQYTQQSILQLHPRLQSPLSVIYNQIDYHFRSEKERNQTSLIQQKKTDWIFIGRLWKEKWIETILKALPSIRQEIPRFRLHIVSDPSDKEKLMIDNIIKELSIEQMIIWHNTIQDDKLLRDLMLSCAIGIVPSISEWFCYTAVQMEALWLPIIASRTGSLPEVLDHQTTIFIPYWDREALSKAVISFFHKKQDSTRYTIKKRFSNTLLAYITIFSAK